MGAAHHRQRRGASVGRYALLIALAVIMLGPLLWMARVALMPVGGSLEFSGLWSESVTFATVTALANDSLLIRALLNSLFVGAAVTAANVVFCFMVGYALSRKRFPGGRLLFGSALLTLMVPVHILIVPLYLLLTKAGIFDTYWALILPFAVSPIGVFMIKQYLDGIPQSLEEAAYIDGAGEMRLLWSVLAPICKPILAVLAIQVFLINWNSFLFPFILTSSDSLRTLPVALALMQGYQAIDWQSLMAGATVAVIPVLIVFLIFQRQIVSGITAGAIKQ